MPICIHIHLAVEHLRNVDGPAALVLAAKQPVDVGHAAHVAQSDHVSAAFGQILRFAHAHGAANAGIFDGDVLIVDRSLKLANGKVIVAILNGELLVRRFHKNFSSAFLVPENRRYKPINLGEFSDFMVWGVVVHSIHTL